MGALQEASIERRLVVRLMSRSSSQGYAQYHPDNAEIYVPDIVLAMLHPEDLDLQRLSRF